MHKQIPLRYQAMTLVVLFVLFALTQSLIVATLSDILLLIFIVETVIYFVKRSKGKDTSDLSVKIETFKKRKKLDE
jgi:uncharacterized membrane protein